MSAAAAVHLVAGREVRERGRSKVFWVGTSVLLAGVVAAIVVPAMLGHYRQQTFRVGTVGAAPPGLTSSVIADAAALGGTAHIRAVGSAAAARSALETQALDLVIDGGTAVVVRGQNTDPAAAGLAHLVALDLAVRARLRAAGLPADRIRGTFSAAPAPVRSLIPVTPGTEASKAIVVAGTILLYLSLATYGSWVTSGVLEEKSSRVAEVILSAVRPREPHPGGAAHSWHDAESTPAIRPPSLPRLRGLRDTSDGRSGPRGLERGQLVEFRRLHHRLDMRMAEDLPLAGLGAVEGDARDYRSLDPLGPGWPTAMHRPYGSRDDTFIGCLIAVVPGDRDARPGQRPQQLP